MDADSEYVLLFVYMCLVHIFCVVAFFVASEVVKVVWCAFSIATPNCPL